jgi:hypothetical protein
MDIDNEAKILSSGFLSFQDSWKKSEESRHTTPHESLYMDADCSIVLSV